MSYFTFLGWCVGIPLLLLAIMNWWDGRQGRKLPRTLQAWPASAVVIAHVIVAVLYTTPWDNYLVATNVWWYNPELVTGIVLGWVPIEEYTFFVVQTMMTSLWIFFLARRLPMETWRSPVLMLLAPSDGVIDTQAARNAFTRIGARDKRLVEVGDTEDAMQHVIAGRILSPGSTDRVATSIVDWARSLPKEQGAKP